jgi:hypothetical protein
MCSISCRRRRGRIRRIDRVRWRTWEMITIGTIEVGTEMEAMDMGMGTAMERRWLGSWVENYWLLRVCLWGEACKHSQDQTWVMHILAITRYQLFNTHHDILILQNGPNLILLRHLRLYLPLRFRRWKLRVPSLVNSSRWSPSKGITPLSVERISWEVSERYHAGDVMERPSQACGFGETSCQWCCIGLVESHSP